MKLCMMFCNEPRMEIMDIPDDIAADIDNMEEFITEKLGYNTDEMEWQCYYEFLGINFTDYKEKLK